MIDCILLNFITEIMMVFSDCYIIVSYLQIRGMFYVAATSYDVVTGGCVGSSIFIV